MEVKFKKLHPNAILPQYAKSGDAGMDIVAINSSFDNNADGSKIITYHTGLSVEIPPGFMGLVLPRSSIYKTSLVLTNSCGLLDSGFRGEILAKFRVDSNARPMSGSTYLAGDRICQLVILPYPVIEPVWAETLSETERGESGFGSSGR